MIVNVEDLSIERTLKIGDIIRVTDNHNCFSTQNSILSDIEIGDHGNIEESQIFRKEVYTGKAYRIRFNNHDNYWFRPDQIEKA